MKYLFYFLGIVLVVSICTFVLINSQKLFPAFAQQTKTVASGIQSSATGGLRSEQSTIPEHVPYMFLFQHTANLQRTDAIGQFKEKTHLSEPGFQKLLVTANACQREIKLLDAQARLIVEEFHRRNPKDSLPAGQAPPPPPNELSVLQRSRNSIILSYRDRLKIELGEASFQQIETFIENEITPKIQVK